MYFQNKKLVQKYNGNAAIYIHHMNYQPPTSLELLFVLFKIIVTSMVKDQVHNARNTILLRNDCNYEGKI